MKFLPTFRPAALLMLAVVCAGCATAANRRELYNTSDSRSGTWHDYDRRRQAELLTGVNGGSAPSVLPDSRGRATTPPPAGTPGPLPPGASVSVPQSPMTPDAAGGAPAAGAAPNVPAPVDVPGGAAPGVAPDPGAGAAPVLPPDPTPPAP